MMSALLDLDMFLACTRPFPSRRYIYQAQQGYTSRLTPSQRFRLCGLPDKHCSSRQKQCLAHYCTWRSGKPSSYWLRTCTTFVRWLSMIRIFQQGKTCMMSALLDLDMFLACSWPFPSRRCIYQAPQGYISRSRPSRRFRLCGLPGNLYTWLRKAPLRRLSRCLLGRGDRFGWRWLWFCC